MKHFNPIPEIAYGRPHGNVPRFIKRYYTAPKFDLKYIMELFQWAELEYSDTLFYSVSTGNKQLYNRILEHNLFHIVAHTKVFSQILQSMDENLWYSLPNPIKKAMIETKKIHDTLVN